MNVFRLTLLFFATMICFQLAFSANSTAQEAPSPSKGAPGSGPTVEGNGTESHSADIRYLRDQIDLRLQFDNGAAFVLSTRPGENVYITKAVGHGKEKRFALVVVPTPFGQDPVAREELMQRSRAEVGFRLLPFCLNAAGSPRPTDKSSAASCLPRPSDDTAGDFVFPLTGFLKKDVAVGEQVDETVTGAGIKVLEYRESGFASFQENNPYSKCCRVEKGIEVCACGVLTWGASCNSGCPVSAEMRAELDVKR